MPLVQPPGAVARNQLCPLPTRGALAVRVGAFVSRSVRRAGCAAVWLGWMASAGATSAGTATAATAAATDRPAATAPLPLGLVRVAPPTDLAHGLIVRLKDAAPNWTPPSSLQAAADEQARRRDTERWRGVARHSVGAGLSGVREPQWRPVGRDQQVLDFGRTLSRAEAARLAERLQQRPDVDWVAPNTMERRLQISDDPLSAQQWWLRPAGGTNGNVLADRLRGVPGFVSAWRAGAMPHPSVLAGQGPVVAVLDTGITPHPDLAGRVLPGYDFVSEPHFANDGNGRDADASDPGDWVSASDRTDPRFAGCVEQRSSWHGTVIAGLIAANADNGVGVAGIDRHARILPVRVAGKCGAAVSDIIDGMRWAGGLAVPGVPLNPFPARIINISFGGSAVCSREYQAAIDELRARGVVVVAAAGNEHAAVSRPASCQGVVGVASLNRDGFKAHYSNFGPALASHGVATVGGDDARDGAWRELLADGGLVTVWNNGATQPGNAEYAKLFGTSFAAPLVAGAMSLMLSVNPALTAEQLMAGVRRTARPHVTSTLAAVCSDQNPGRCLCTTQTCGAGILDAEQALRYAANPGSWVAPALQAQVVDTAELRQAVALGQDLPPNTISVASTSVSVASNDVTSGVAAGATGKGGGAVAPWAVLALCVAVAGLGRSRSPSASPRPHRA